MKSFKLLSLVVLAAQFGGFAQAASIVAPISGAAVAPQDCWSESGHAEAADGEFVIKISKSVPTQQIFDVFEEIESGSPRILFVKDKSVYVDRSFMGDLQKMTVVVQAVGDTDSSQVLTRKELIERANAKILNIKATQGVQVQCSVSLRRHPGGTVSNR